ncbi:MAG TPA: PepSY-associated TM helix domain-containing protein [Gemmatimonadales bacterium]|nr:PepSY-associated TM helix domain-containing protein [Gemmatimonadales bacterium]
MRQTLLWLHRWVALITGFFLVLIAVSGCLISLEGPIDRALHPALFAVPPAQGLPALPPDSLVTLVARGMAATPWSREGPVVITSLRPPEADGRPAILVDSQNVDVFADPYRGTILGVRTPAEDQASFGRWVRNVHERLLTGETGSFVVGVITILTLITVIVGVVLWWRDKGWQVRWTASWKRIVFDLHHLLGIAATPVLVVMLASAIAIRYDGVRDLIGKLDPAPAPDQLPQSSAPDGTPTITLASVLATANQRMPGARPMVLNIPADPKQPFLVILRYPEDRTPAGRSRITLDRYTGAVLLEQSSRTAGLGTKINNLKRSMHTGDLFGTATDVLWFLASLALASQAVSGFLMWWNARGARAKRS